MSNNVVDATHRFSGQGRERSPRPSLIEQLSRAIRVPVSDRPILATRLGELAAQINRERPQLAAKSWFERAWEGDRWAKRKRLVCFPGEALTDPLDEGAYVATGADWATLIQQAAAMRYPGDGQSVVKDRTRLHREILRGTSFLPAQELTPLRDGGAQDLLVAWAHKIASRIEENTQLDQLWEVLKLSPFDLVSYDLERNERLGLRSESQKYEGDDYSTGPLGPAAKRANEISQYTFISNAHSGFRFESSTSDSEPAWSYPSLRLGLRGHRRLLRLFVVPHDFMADLPVRIEEDAAPDDCIIEWLITKGLMSGEYYEVLPEVQFDAAKGFGWTEMRFEFVQPIWLSVRPKSDGTPGLWLSAWLSDLYLYPSVPEFDALAIEASSLPEGLGSGFVPMIIGNSNYEFLGWPTDGRFLVDGNPPEGAVTGLLKVPIEELLEIEGWVDDTNNIEMQNLLFHNAEKVRFCPSVAMDSAIPPPCRQGTIAALLFGNAACEVEYQVGALLIAQARQLSTIGLGFHEALLGYHKGVIDRL